MVLIDGYSSEDRGRSGAGSSDLASRMSSAPAATRRLCTTRSRLAVTACRMALARSMGAIAAEVLVMKQPCAGEKLPCRGEAELSGGGHIEGQLAAEIEACRTLKVPVFDEIEDIEGRAAGYGEHGCFGIQAGQYAKVDFGFTEEAEGRQTSVGELPDKGSELVVVELEEGHEVDGVDIGGQRSDDPRSPRKPGGTNTSFTPGGARGVRKLVPSTVGRPTWGP